MGQKWKFTPEQEAIIAALWTKKKVTFQDIRHQVGDPPDYVLYKKATVMGLGTRHRSIPRMDARKPGTTGKINFKANSQSTLAKLQKHHDKKSKKRFKLPKTPPEDLAIPVEQRRTLMTLKQGQCKWPINHPGAEDFFFCGDTANGPYCARHARRAFVPLGSRNL
jgi:hypothetical protein